MEKQENKFSFKELLSILQKCSSANMGKGVFVLILFSVLVFVISMLSLVPNASLALGGAMDMTLGSSLLTLVVFLAGNVINNVLFYGVLVIFARMIELKRVTIGYMFIGFKQDKRVFITAILLTVLLLLAAFAATFTGVAAGLLNPGMDGTKTAQQALMAVLPMFAVYLAFMLILLLPFIFSFLFIYVDRDLKVLKAFGLSAKLFFKNFFRFFGFVICSGSWWLVAYIVCTAVTVIIPSDANAALLPISSIASIVGVVTQFVTLVRIFMSIPLFFFERIGAIQKTQPDEEKLDLLEEMADDLK